MLTEYNKKHTLRIGYMRCKHMVCVLLYHVFRRITHLDFILKLFRYVFGDDFTYDFLCAGEVLPVKHKYKAIRSHETKSSVIIMFDNELETFGLSDRLRAISSIGWWAKKHSLVFKIYCNSSFPLSDYLMPNNSDWRIDQTELDFSNSKPLAIYSYSKIFDSNANMALQRNKLDTILTGKHIPLQIHLYTNTFCYDEYFRESFKELFVPSPYLLGRIRRNKAIIGVSYISISFRFASLLGDFKDTFGSTLKKNEQLKLMEKCKSSILDILSENPQIGLAVITSDSSVFLSYVSSMPQVMVSTGRPGHICLDTSSEVYDSAFDDLFTIASATKAYQVRTKEMYDSGFAQRAARINGIPFEKIIV